MPRLKSFPIAVVTAFAVLAAASTIHADGSRQNTLTFKGPVTLPGIVLPAGSYSFKVLNESTTQDIVVVRNVDETKLYYVGLTNNVQRPRSLPANQTIMFGEARADAPPPIAAWYPIGEKIGHQFLYR